MKGLYTETASVKGFDSKCVFENGETFSGHTKRMEILDRTTIYCNENTKYYLEQKVIKGDLVLKAIPFVGLSKDIKEKQYSILDKKRNVIGNIFTVNKKGLDLNECYLSIAGQEYIVKCDPKGTGGIDYHVYREENKIGSINKSPIVKDMAHEFTIEVNDELDSGDIYVIIVNYLCNTEYNTKSNYHSGKSKSVTYSFSAKDVLTGKVVDKEN